MNTNKLKVAGVLTALTCVGVVATVVLTAKSAEKAEAQGLTPFDKYNWEDKETRKEMVKTYIPSIAAASATIALAISSHMVSRKQVAAIIGTAATSAALLRQYKQTTREIVGDENYSKIVREVNKKKATMTDDIKQKVKELNNKPAPVRPMSEQYCAFFDEYTGKHYIATMIAQMQAENLMNMNLATRNRANLADYYGFMGETIPEMFNNDFWDHDIAENWINFEHHWNDDHTVCIVSYTPPTDLE